MKKMEKNQKRLAKAARRANLPSNTLDQPMMPTMRAFPGASPEAASYQMPPQFMPVHQQIGSRFNVVNEEFTSSDALDSMSSSHTMSTSSLHFTEKQYFSTMMVPKNTGIRKRFLYRSSSYGQVEANRFER